ncbi:MAG: universal stress protein [Hyphomicrobiaceae bacterium]|nr:universal stress protein [Hyphomicrobiaceae bacterium]
MSDFDAFRDYQHKFLVVIDETVECDRAVTFAANRVKRTGGTVLLAYVISSDDFQHWLGVEDVMRAEAMQEAASLLDQRARRIAEIGPIKVERVIREGRRAEEVEKLINEDQGIAILVLAAGTSSEGPGPLVSSFALKTGGSLRIPVTIVPGSLTDQDIAAIC